MKCVFCGIALQSAAARYCVQCYREHVKPCPTCMEDTGKGGYKAKKAFRPHWHEGMGPCKVCGGEHPDTRHIVCPVCKNSRVVMDEPKGATT